MGEVRWIGIQDYSENLAVVEEDERYGFIDEDGNVVIEPQYAAANSFSEGLAGVRSGGLWQFINRDNEVVIPARYSSVSAFKDGRADVFLPGTGWQIIDREGRLLYFVNASTVEAYEAAQADYEAGNFQEAYDAFSALAGYQDSDERAKEAGYQAAQALMDAGEYAQAAALFNKLDGYLDSAELAEQAVASAPEGTVLDTAVDDHAELIGFLEERYGVPAEEAPWFMADLAMEGTWVTENLLIALEANEELDIDFVLSNVGDLDDLYAAIGFEP